jgi:hypothetical protein
MVGQPRLYDGFYRRRAEVASFTCCFSFPNQFRDSITECNSVNTRPNQDAGARKYFGRREQPV